VCLTKKIIDKTDNRIININKPYYIYCMCAINLMFCTIISAAHFVVISTLLLSQYRENFPSFTHTLLPCYGYTHKNKMALKLPVCRWNVSDILHRKVSWYNSVFLNTLPTSYSKELRNFVRNINVLMLCVRKLMTGTTYYCMFLFTPPYFIQYWGFYIKWCDININVEHKIWNKRCKICISTRTISFNSMWKQLID
jgi:hypothetical protein